MIKTSRRSLALALGWGSWVLLGAISPAASLADTPRAATLPWMSPDIIARQDGASEADQREAVARQRAQLLLKAMSLPQKMQQLTGSPPEILPELPQCFGGRHISGIAALGIPTFRVTNGPVGLGQNDCVDAQLVAKAGSAAKAAGLAYTHPSSAKATALPSAMGIAASFDPDVASAYGEIIANEMHSLGLHVFEAPGVNLARLPILGRNFEYFGEDPYLSGVMAVAETKAVQSNGLIAMLKHFVANEQETNRMSIQETVDQQTLREIYLLPFEMGVKDGGAAAVMCAYNYVNGKSSCENEDILTGVLRREWGFTGYVQSDFFAMKSTAATLKAGLDNEMPTPLFWSVDKLGSALSKGEITAADINTALERRYTQMFKAGIFERPLVQTPMAVEENGRKARDIGTRAAVLLQNGGALPFRRDVQSVMVIGKGSQVYAQQAVAGGSLPGEPMGSGGGSSDVVPHYTVTPVEGLRNVLKSLGNSGAAVKLALVDDGNISATIDGARVSFADVTAQAGAADAVIIMAGTISEEGADRATFAGASGRQLAGFAAAGDNLDWYAPRSNVIALTNGRNAARNSQTVEMIRALLAAPSRTGVSMNRKTALVLKDNAGVAMDPHLVGPRGPAILESWFPGQEDGNIVAELLFGVKNPSGKLPVTFPYVGKGFLDNVSAEQFPGLYDEATKKQTVRYAERLNIGYRWYDANVSGNCKLVKGRNPCVAFPFGHGLSYTSFAMSNMTVAYDPTAKLYRAKAVVANTGKMAGAEVVQAYLALPRSADAAGAPQPPKRLVGFERVELKPGERKEVEIIIDPAASNHPLSVWRETEHKWVVPEGQFALWLGKSSSPIDLMLAGRFSYRK